MRSLLCAVLGLCLLGACAAVPSKLSADLPPGKKAAVVVAFGPEIGVTARGVTVFGNSINSVPVPEWNLEGIAVDEMTKVLLSRMQVVRGTADGVIRIPNLEYLRYTSAVEETAHAKIHLAESVDLVVLLTISGTGLVNSTNDLMYGFDTGLGVSKRYRALDSVPPYVHAFLRVLILDGESLTPLADSLLLGTPRNNIASIIGRDTPLLIQYFDDFEWHNKWEEMTEAQHDLVHRTLIKLITEGIDTTLPKMLWQ